MEPDLRARLLYRDALMLVLDKPAGLPVHAGPGGGPNLEALFDALRFGLPRPPALAHRLDRDTSGCLVLGRHRKALARLGRLFAEGLVDKTYWAVVAGAPTAPEGRIDLPLTKIARGNGWQAVADPAGQPAITDYRVLGRSESLAWLELRPVTGRTHQIRAHCEQLGTPVLGDALYGDASGAPLHLHARALAVPLYPRRPSVVAVAPVPVHMRAALADCGWRDDADAPAPRLDAAGGDVSP